MTQDYLQRFQALTRKQADPELIRRWEWDARFNADKNIKNELANAKRTVTALRKSRAQFSQLKPEHDLALNAAANALASLCAELTALAAWAKDYGAFCATAFRQENDAEVEAVAQQRWGQDAAAVGFEADLMRELSSREGRLAFGQWLQGSGRHHDVKVEDISCAVDGLAPGQSERARAALTVLQGKDRHPHEHRWDSQRGPAVVCRWADYEAYLAYRKEVAQTTARIVKIASGQ